MIAGLIGCTIGVGITKLLADYYYVPNQVVVRDLNGDERPDLVVMNRRGNKFVYLQQDNGTYRRLDQVQRSFTDSIEEKLEKIR